jgi:hypothetical protein
MPAPTMTISASWCSVRRFSCESDVSFDSIVGTEAVDVLRVRMCGCDDAVTPGGSPAILVPENIVSIVTACCRFREVVGAMQV